MQIINLNGRSYKFYYPNQMRIMSIFYINEILRFIFVRLSKSAFGNYVVQNFLKQVELDLL